MTDRPPGRAEDVHSEVHLASLYIMLIVAYADEKLAPKERDMLRKQVVSRCEDEESARGIRSFIDSLPTSVESDDWVEGAIETIRARLTQPEALREGFAMALEMAAADGKIEVRETAALARLAEQLGIDSEFARARLRRVRKADPDQLPDLDKTPWQMADDKGS